MGRKAEKASLPHSQVLESSELREISAKFAKNRKMPPKSYDIAIFHTINI